MHVAPRRICATAMTSSHRRLAIKQDGEHDEQTSALRTIGSRKRTSSSLWFLMLLLHLLHHLLRVEFRDRAGDAILGIRDDFGQNHAAVQTHFLDHAKRSDLVAGPHVGIALV